MKKSTDSHYEKNVTDRRQKGRCIMCGLGEDFHEM